MVNNKSKSNKTISNWLRWFLIIGVSLILLFVASYIFRGWLRVTLVPKVINVTSGNAVTNFASAEIGALGDPFTLLGYDSTTKESECRLVAARGLSTQYECVYVENGWTEILQNSNDKKQLYQSAVNILAALKNNGWEGAYTENEQATSLTTLIRNINDGIDYTPDASYTKASGDINCWISNTTAFSKPKNPAISTNFWCSRTVNVFGDPKVDDVIIYE